MSSPSICDLPVEERCRILVEALTDHALFLLDPEGRICSWNAAATRITGYTTDAILGHPLSILDAPDHGTESLGQDALRIAQDHGKYDILSWCMRENGSRFWASIVIDPLRSAQNQLIGYAVIIRDITDKRAADACLQQAREDLFHSQKLEAIGQLTGGVVHDFNNLLTVIVSGTELADRYVGDEPRLKRLIISMREAALRGEKLTKGLLALSRRGTMQPEPIDVVRRVCTSVALLRQSLCGDITIRHHVHDDVWPIHADPRQLDLALFNVGISARDAMPRGGRITVKASNVALAGEKADLHGEYVSIAMHNTGIAMAADMKASALDDLLTTRDVGRGYGLGLKHACGFARQSGGALTIDCEPDVGTTVTFYLPAVRPGVAVRATMRAPDMSQGRSDGVPTAVMESNGQGEGTILLVEDDPDVSELTTGLLESEGYAVKTAEDGPTALRLLRDGLHADLVLSDIMMPGGMNGAELAVTIREEFPTVFVLLTTGYAAAAASTLAQQFPVIRKPFRRAELMDTVGKILGG